MTCFFSFRQRQQRRFQLFFVEQTFLVFHVVSATPQKFMLIIVTTMITVWNSYRRMESSFFIALFFCCFACVCHSLSFQSWHPSKIRSNLVGGSDHHFASRKTSILSLKRTPEEYSSILQTKKASRRDVLATASSILATATFPNIAQAAEPVNAKDTDSVLAIAKRKLRPKPPRLLRKKLSQDFAVLLMRSSYDALDAMDCVAMDQFQRDFFLIRVAEYQTYTKQLGDGMVKQGELTDPFYFDFISFAQYKTINREVTQNPPYVFEEQQIPPEGSDTPSQNENGTARFIPVIVKRDPKLTNALLVPTHTSMVGASILDKLESTFGETELKIPKYSDKPDLLSLLAGLKAIVNIFLVNGYAFRGEIIATSPKTFAISLNAPATLWSGKVLQLEKNPLDNDFLSKTLQEYIKRCGYETTKTTIKYEGNDEELTISIR